MYVRKNREVRGAAVPRMDTAELGLSICTIPFNAWITSSHFKCAAHGQNRQADAEQAVVSKRVGWCQQHFLFNKWGRCVGKHTHWLNCVKRLPLMMVPRNTEITCTSLCLRQVFPCKHVEEQLAVHV